jgi:hypothetical protein
LGKIEGVSEPQKKPKWRKEKTIVFASLVILLLVMVPILIILFFLHKLVQAN